MHRLFVYKSLAQAGYRRVGLIGLHDPAFAYEAQTAVYRQAMWGAGLDYDAVVRCPATISESMAAAEQILALKKRPDAIYVADDYIMDGVAQVLSMAGIRPGHDIGVISMSKPEKSLPAGYDWSKIEFGLQEFSEIAVDTIVRRVERGAMMKHTIALQPEWIPGQTHLQLGGSKWIKEVVPERTSRRRYESIGQVK